ncbi:MAG: 3-mercaptopyruvate sulfurtransferase [Alphaproteobacteria bacterium BRH_c36]|nr:MAG: 3-mercaptopyruvate sulfurtransferase [Alphaproteobacteria bacterium BRH_c36]
MTTPGREVLVETEWLAEHLSAPDLVVLDASWHLPTQNRSGRKEFLAEHIPGAQFFDLDELSDEKSDLPHMLPSTVKFASRMKEMGIGDGVRLVVYDSMGIYSAARCWWTFRVMGHEDVAVLNGGLPKWRAEGRPLEDGPARARAKLHFTPRVNAALVADRDDIASYIEHGGVQIVDARPAPRFIGDEAEPRAGLVMGHMPGAKNLPYSRLVNRDGTLRSAEEIKAAAAAAGIDIGAPIANTCGSGVTAAIVALALASIGRPDTSVYDGSWAEWGRADLGLPYQQG